MNFQTNIAFNVMTLVATLGLSGLNAQSADGYKGTFTLPVEAHWSGVVLEPGQYSIVVPPAYRQPVIQIRGAHGTFLIMEGPTSVSRLSNHGRITLAELDGVYVVRQLDAGQLGQSFYFNVPKEVRARLAKADTGSSEHQKTIQVLDGQ